MVKRLPKSLLAADDEIDRTYLLKEALLKREYRISCAADSGSEIGSAVLHAPPQEVHGQTLPRDFLKIPLEPYIPLPAKHLIFVQAE